jgi:hypothetical protein
VLYEESTETLLCGDLFTQLGNGPALTDGDVATVGGPVQVFLPRPRHGRDHPLAKRTLALMHDPSFTGDGAAALRALADNYDRRVTGRRWRRD